MLPSELTADSFRGYPPQARQLATAHLSLLRDLPISFLPLLLRELIAYDWKFPAERRELDQQFTYLASQSSATLTQLMSAFARLNIPTDMVRSDWVTSPTAFSEQLTTHLWATHQIDSFRSAAVDYVGKMHAAFPSEPLSLPRLGIVVIGLGVKDNHYPLFRKLRPHGVYFTNVKSDDGLAPLLDFTAARAKRHSLPYTHWYIEGGAQEAVRAGITSLSYASLSAVRSTLQDRMQKAYSSGMGPEAFRSMLAGLRPDELGPGTADDPVLSRFQVSVLTEGSGTQVFSTTFVQWSAREALRRAEPLTLLLRFTPRQRMRSMNELLSESQHAPDVDPQGSLVDADMGAYYTWLNQQRLPGAEHASFLVWFEGHNEALAIAPSLGRRTESKDPVDLASLLQRISPAA